MSPTNSFSVINLEFRAAYKVPTEEPDRHPIFTCPTNNSEMPNNENGRFIEKLIHLDE